MNLKFLFIFFVILNIFSTIVDLNMGNTSNYNEFLFDNFDMNQDSSTGQITFQGNLTGDLGEEYGQVADPATGIVSDALSTFIDSIKLIIGVIALFATPLPFLVVISNFNLYWLIQTVLMLFFVSLWILSVLEFLRGGRL